ncbi:MAG: hypothetical protein M3015_01530 [Bacteroidota bacterium]|nr:hypothetical protein [Bacteroidota bacterium]
MNATFPNSHQRQKIGVIFLLTFAPLLMPLSYAQLIKNPKLQRSAQVLLGVLAGSKKMQNQKQVSGPAANDTAAVLDFNNKPAGEFATANIQDISGTWEGEESNGGLIMYYSLCLTKLSNNSYSGFDYCIWKKTIDRKPIAENAPNAKKSFIGNFENGILNFTEIEQLENSKWGLITEKLKLVDDNGSPAIINDKENEPQRKFYLKRTAKLFRRSI